MKLTHAFAGLTILATAALPAHAQDRRDDRRHGNDHQQQHQDERARELSAREQQQRIAEQRQRDAQYQRQLDRQMRMGQQQAAMMQQQRRNAQYAAQQQYLANLRTQRERLQAQRDYNNDPAYRTAASYRYNRNGTYYQTNQYGADVLKQAVNLGYQQGVQFGQADRNDGVRSNYQNSYAYRDANYGYTGQYVSQADYNYYFRQGFQRGYQDAFGNQSQYGSGGSILGNILTSILGLQPIQ